mmetsp:Transcript_22953/g.26592  ORF Transcript_22953/g.26592 Transcript_22953/m.26592 type:complete len:153 (-) Transcript_22953:261-719(-)
MTNDTLKNHLYEERWRVPWAPLVFFLPIFYKYNVIVTDENLSFGYGFDDPVRLTSKTISKSNIEQDSITVGNASWKDNLLKFGGWGIRLGLDGTIAYNAKNGNYIEIVEKRNNGTTQKYRFASNDAEKVVSLLRVEKSSDEVGGPNNSVKNI